MITMDAMESLSRPALSCPQCHRQNLPQWNYCAQCGAALWWSCLACGEPCATCEDYCGACGACLEDAAAEKIEAIEAELATAAELGEAFRFREALLLLTRIAKTDHPRLAEPVGRARAAAETLAAECERWRSATVEACRAARERLGAFDYDGAAATLDAMPPPLWDDALRRLRSEVGERQREIARLTDEIREAIERKQLLDASSRVERLLALKPDHTYGRKIAERLEKTLVAAAAKMLKEHRYDEARRLLDQTPDAVDLPEFAELNRQARELSWLSWDVRNAPAIDATLVAVADRLQRLAPGDARSAKLGQELKQRLAGRNSPPLDGSLAWARPPKETPLGAPVEWLTGFRRVRCAAEVEAELARHPGRFAVACGLALGGLGREVVQINLLANRKAKLLGRVARIVRTPILGPRQAWGIDVGTSSLKTVRLSSSGAGQVVADAAILAEHSKPLYHAANEADELKVLAETLESFRKTHAPKGERICVGLPGRLTLTREVQTPPVDAAKLAKLIAFEAAHVFPFPLEQLAWDFHGFDTVQGIPNADGQAVNDAGRLAMFVAAKQASVERILGVFEQSGLRVDVLTPDFVALHNFVAYDDLGEPGQSQSAEGRSAVATLDIGADATNLIVTSPKSLWYRGCGVAAQTFARALVKEFNLSIAQAEQWKRSPESSDRFGDFCEALAPVFDDLLDEVRQALAAHSAARPNERIARVLGVGGGFALHGLLRCLRSGR
jgi:type IV pilus assembly protein PilM